MKGLVACVLVAVSGVGACQAPLSWKSVGIGGGGALFAPSWNPYNAQQLTLACDMSGQYRSLDQGKTWSVTPFFNLQSGRTWQKVQYTEDPLVQYNIDFTGDLRRPVKSVDGGLTWSPLGGNPTGNDAWYLAADPANHNRLLVTSYNSIYFSSNGGANFGIRGTDSSGAGWHLAGVFWDGATIVGAQQNGLFVSTDGGASFASQATTGIPSSEQIVSFAAGKNASGVVRFYCVTLDAGSVWSGILGDDHWSYASVYTMKWGTNKWVKRVNGIAAGDHPFYVDMATNQTSTAYLAGGSEVGVPVVYKTTDSGTTWTQVFQSTNNQNVITGWSGDGGDRTWGYGELVFGFDVDSASSSRVAFTDYGFCHISTNGGTSWKQTYVKPSYQNPAGAPTPKGKFYATSGLENTSSWTVCWSDAQNVWVGYSDIRGIRSQNGGSTWSFYTGFTTNSAYQIVRHPNGTLYMASSGTHDMYESTHLTDSSIDGGNGAVLASADKGKTWTAVGSLGKVVVAVALDPTNANRLFASVSHSTQGGIYVCNNPSAGASATWTKLSAPPRTEGHANTIMVLNDGTLVCTFSGRRTTNFTDSSGVFVSTNGGASWADRSSPNMHWWTRDLVVDPTDSAQNTWYVGVYGGWGGTANGRGGVYRTIDRGLHWTRLWNSDRVSSVGVNPLNGNHVFAATEVEGLWFCANAKAATPAFAQLGEYPFRHPQRIFFNPFKAGEVWITSFGGGTYIGQMQSGP